MSTKYTSKHLIPGERILYSARLHNFAFVFPLILLVVGVGLLCMPLLTPGMQGAEQAAEQASSGYYSSIKGKVVGFFAFVGSFLPPGVATALESANELRLILFGALFVLLGSVYLITTTLKKLSTEQVITNKKIIHKKGFITVDESEISLFNVEGVKVFQTVLDRILNRGMVHVNGVGMEQIEIRGIVDPSQFRHHAYTAVEKFSGRHHPQHQTMVVRQHPDEHKHLPGR